MLLYNDGALLLPMAIADKALFGFNSVDDLWWQEFITILRNVTMEEGVTEDPMSKWTFLRIFRSTLRNADLGKKVDGRLCFSGLNL